MKLNDREFSSLLDEMVQAVRSDLPIADAMGRLADDRLGRVGRVAGSLAEDLRAGGSLADAMSRIKSPSAHLVAGACGSISIDSAAGSGGDGRINVNLLERLANRIRSRGDAARVSRLMWFYPIVLLVVAYAVVLLVVVPLIHEYRFHITEQPDGVHWPGWVMATTDWIGATPWIPPIVFLLILAMIVLFVRSGHALGRSLFVGPVRKSLFCHALADHMTEGVPESQAILSASSLSGYTVSGANPTLKDNEIAMLLRQAGGVSQMVVNDDESSRALTASTIAQLRYLGNLFQYVSKRHQRRWTIILPQIATFVIGVAFMTGYVWFVLGPIYREVAQW